MMNWKKIAATGLVATTMGLAVVPQAEAQWRRHHHRGWGAGGAVAAGVLGGALLGAALAPRPAWGYGAPVYGAPVYGAPIYDAPVYAPRPVYYHRPVRRCWRDFAGYDGWGRPLYQRVCNW